MDLNDLSFGTVIALGAPLLILEGLFSGSEIALLSADKVALKARASSGSARARLALELARNPERILSSTLVVTALCVITFSGLVALYTLQQYEKHSELVAVLISSPLIVIFGELVPKTLYQRHATRLAPWVAYPVLLAYWVLYPITKILNFYTSLVGKALRPIEEILTGSKGPAGRDELLTVLTYGKKETEINAADKKIIKRIFDFRGTQAKHVMIPLIRVEAIEQQASLKDALERFKIHRHSRMPVYQGRIDNIVGVLRMNDLFNAPDPQQPIRPYITGATYIAETHLLEDLLTEMKHEETELVIVVDEYGGAIGILTYEDIVEEIVGEIEDEHDDTVADYKELGDRRYLVQARMEITAINEHLHLELPEGDYETVGGFLLQQFSKIPEAGDELYFDTPAASLKFFVRKANERQIQSVLVAIVADHRSTGVTPKGE